MLEKASRNFTPFLSLEEILTKRISIKETSLINIPTKRKKAFLILLKQKIINITKKQAQKWFSSSKGWIANNIINVC